MPATTHKQADGAEFIVIRAHPHCPPGYVPASLEGVWFTRPAEDTLEPLGRIAAGASATAYATGLVEYRKDDGAAAQVFEVPPPGQAGWPERLAWRAVDDLGHLAAAWHHRLSAEELTACDLVIEAVRREANAEARIRA